MPTPVPPFDHASGASRGGPERRLERPRDGRWLAGVCAALARYSDRRVAVIRSAFVLTIPFFGLPIVAYLAWWLILPEEGDHGRPRASVLFSGLASILLSFGVVLALLTLAAAGAVATAFGLGWGVVVVAAAVLAIGALWMRENNPGWILLPLAALVLPAAVVVGLDLRVDRQIGDVTVAPEGRSELDSGGYRMGIGDLLVDLRHYDWGRDGTVPLKVEGGLGRTVIALPPHRCVAVRVHYDTHSGPLSSAVHALGFESEETSGVTVFGRSSAGGEGEVAMPARGKVPTLSIDFSSDGGRLFVRDYPRSIDPLGWPGWPGTPYFGVAHETALSKAQIRRLQRLNRRIVRELPGPCANGGRR